MPPMFGGPPLASKRLNPNQWARLDPSEILVHNVKSQDQLDDILEDRMRAELARELLAKARKAAEPSSLDAEKRLQSHVHEFVEGQTILELQQLRS